MGTNSNAQLETQLLAEWLMTLPRGWPNKTHINVGQAVLEYQGQVLTPSQQAAFGVWNDWADARVFTGAEVWIIEAKIVNTGGAYGQLLDYVSEYPDSADYRQFKPAPIVPIVLCAFERLRTRNVFAGFGVRTILYTPSWAGNSLATKVFSSQAAG